MKKDQNLRKEFLGKLDGFINKVEKNFQKKHLKAYLRGDEYFTFGRNQKTREPEWFKVLYTFLKQPKK